MSRNIVYRTLPDTKKHYECLISICIHDSPELFLYQINKINKYIPECAIVVHVNSDTIILNENELPGNVYINTQWFNEGNSGHAFLWRGFISNVIHGYSVCFFDRVLFMSSSCIVYRKLDWKIYPKDAVCITEIHEPHNKRPDTIEEAKSSCVWWYPSASRDTHLVCWLQNKSFNRIQGGQISGTMLPEIGRAHV